MKTSDIPSWFWETDQPIRDELIHIGPGLKEQRWVSNGHVMLRVDPLEQGELSVSPPVKAGEQMTLKYAHLVLVAAMTEIVSECSGTMLRSPLPPFMIAERDGESVNDFAIRIGDRDFGFRYVTWVKYAIGGGGVTWTQSGNSPAYATSDDGDVFAVIQPLDSSTSPAKKT